MDTSGKYFIKFSNRPQKTKTDAISLMGIYLEVEECDQEFQIPHI